MINNKNISVSEEEVLAQAKKMTEPTWEEKCSEWSQLSDHFSTLAVIPMRRGWNWEGFYLLPGKASCSYWI